VQNNRSTTYLSTTLRKIGGAFFKMAVLLFVACQTEEKVDKPPLNYFAARIS
jgi:hypothetical protein